jgi:Mn-dependent DtxR family transcriptional regulator
LIETSEAYAKLEKMAERLGVNSVEALAKMSKGLKLDKYGYSTLSMTEIQESFSRLQQIRNQLSSDGTINAEDWDYIAENFSGVLSTNMVESIDEILKAKEFQIRA